MCTDKAAPPACTIPMQRGSPSTSNDLATNRAASACKAQYGITNGRDDMVLNHSYLAAQYHRLRTKLGAPKAITASAHRLTQLLCRGAEDGQEYVDQGTQYYELGHSEQQLQLLSVNVKAATGRSSDRKQFWECMFGAHVASDRSRAKKAIDNNI